MIVLSLLVALMIERLRVSPAGWRLDNTAQQFDQWLLQHETFGAARKNEVFGPLMLLIPSLLLAILLLFGTGGLTEFLVNVAVLSLVLGCRVQREAVRDFFLAIERDDSDGIETAEAGFEAAFDLSELEQSSDEDDDEQYKISIGQRLVWMNFRYYFSVIFWFVLFGAAGALGYGLLRANENSCRPLMRWVDWLPVRVAGFAYLLVGHFSKGMPSWLASLGDTRSPAGSLLAIARAAEDTAVDDDDRAQEPQALLGLARRATILLLVAIALATIFGWVV